MIYQKVLEKSNNFSVSDKLSCNSFKTLPDKIIPLSKSLSVMTVFNHKVSFDVREFDQYNFHKL